MCVLIYYYGLTDCRKSGMSKKKKIIFPIQHRLENYTSHTAFEVETHGRNYAWNHGNELSVGYSESANLEFFTTLIKYEFSLRYNFYGAIRPTLNL
jgi:hypothetical protein